MPPLVASLSQLLRDALNRVKEKWDRKWQQGEARLAADENWRKLEPEQKHDLRQPHGLVEGAMPKIEVATTDAILKTLDTVTLSALQDRVVAMPGRYERICMGAAKLMEPKVQEIQVPRRTLKTVGDIDTWAEEVKQQLKDALAKGPIVIR